MGVLEGLDILSVLSDEHREYFSMFCQPRSLVSGETLFSQGEDANVMYILQTGILCVYKTEGGKEVFLGEVYAEEIVGEMALFDNTKKRMATVIAKTAVDLIVIPSFCVDEITQKEPELMEKIHKIITMRNRENAELHQ